jgi:shikimate dehydrogenase
LKRACVIGWPIDHSRSPAIHNYWLKRYGLDGEYTKIAVPPADLGEFLKGLSGHDLQGCNVTFPHKEAAFRFADETEASARAVEAANTLWLENGRLFAANTDTYGFMTYLGLQAPEWKNRDAPVAVLGAGGAARAIVFGFLEAGVPEVRVFNRSEDRAEALARQFGSRVTPCSWNDRLRLAADASVIVNATSVGLKGEGSLALDFSVFDERSVVADIVYVPLETEFIRDARARGLKVVDGLGMLLHQAVPGFEKWFGIRPEVTAELFEMIVADIEAH